MIHVFQQAILDILVYRNVHAMFKAMGELPLNVLSRNPVWKVIQKTAWKRCFSQDDFRNTLFSQKFPYPDPRSLAASLRIEYIVTYKPQKRKRDRLPVPAFFRGQAVEGFLGVVGSTCQSSVWKYLHLFPTAKWPLDLISGTSHENPKAIPTHRNPDKRNRNHNITYITESHHIPSLMCCRNEVFSFCSPQIRTPSYPKLPPSHVKIGWVSV